MYNLVRLPLNDALGEVTMKNLTKHNVATADELAGHLDKLPTTEEIEELICELDVSTLREMSSAMLTASVNYVKGSEGQNCNILSY